jgi:hypothetical protein
MIQQDTEVNGQEFADLIGLSSAAPGRYSALLLAQLLGGHLSGYQNPAKVVHEIEALENGQLGQLKPPILNRHPPLKGLWHKHYIEDGITSMAQNVKRGLDKFGIPFFEQKIREAEAAGEERFLEANDVAQLVHDVVSGNRERLAAQQAITGEWLIFAVHEGRNYYLCLTTHDKSEHQDIRDKIDSVCCREFSFLGDLLLGA